MEKIRVRFGIKTGSWIFPNAAVFVFKMEADKFQTLLSTVQTVRGVLPPDWGGRIVCEAS